MKMRESHCEQREAILVLLLFDSQDFIQRFFNRYRRAQIGQALLQVPADEHSHGQRILHQRGRRQARYAFGQGQPWRGAASPQRVKNATTAILDQVPVS